MSGFGTVVQPLEGERLLLTLGEWPIAKQNMHHWLRRFCYEIQTEIT
jgi:hypothetical protein